MVLHATHYTFVGTLGDLDGLVVGEWDGRDVVVLVEAKHNMNSSWSKATSELFHAHAYWDRLCALDPDVEPDPAVLRDYFELRVADYKHCTVMYALGGVLFSTDLPTSKPPLKTQWFHVRANARGRFTAQLWAGQVAPTGGSAGGAEPLAGTIPIGSPTKKHRME